MEDKALTGEQEESRRELDREGAREREGENEGVLQVSESIFGRFNFFILTLLCSSKTARRQEMFFRMPLEVEQHYGLWQPMWAVRN